MLLKFKIFVSHILSQLTYFFYWGYMFVRVPIIRRKKHIKVLFMLQELAAWKTELLYIAMLKHPRFEPIIAITNSALNPHDKPNLVSYLQSKNYEFLDFDVNPSLIKSIKADFVLYYKPYIGMWPKEVYFFDNRRTIPLSIGYSLSITDTYEHVYKMLYVFSYYFFADNIEVLNSYKKHLGYKAHNIVVTGAPIQDYLLQPKECFQDPWKDKSGRKRIIYAPHHSIPDTNFGWNGRCIEYSTILEFGKTLLDFAHKYKNEITIAFKPHPGLYTKLIKIWGKEEADNYYNEWENGENTQLELGDYNGLFKYSDALIHDSSSFIPEYMYADKPCLFTVRGDGQYVRDSINTFGKSAFDCHELANSTEQIEQFILDIIAGKDFNHEKRQEFRSKYLLPPNGKTACDNIIDAILGSRTI